MHKNWKKLGLALFCSTSVLALTFFLYQPKNLNTKTENNERPLAYAVKIVDEIQRRPSSRLLWVLLNSGEPIYNGEALRTSEHGEVRIQFSDSERYIDLEPDSLIVLKKAEGEIALDLLEGSLFVSSKNEKTKNTEAPLILTSANGKIDLTQANAAITRPKGQSLGIQIVSGKASLQNKNGPKKELLQGQLGSIEASGFEASKFDIKILSPSMSQALTMDSENLKPVHFSWNGITTKDHLSLWTGSQRKGMRLNTKIENGKTEASVLLPFGNHFWKLVATNTQGQITAESSTYKFEIQARYAPTMIFPAVDSEISVEKFPSQVNFKWQKGDEVKSVTLEVWSDAKLKIRILEQTFVKEDSFLLQNLRGGTYYWRMSAFYQESDSTIADKNTPGKIQKFFLRQTQITDQKMVTSATVPPLNLQFDLPASQLTQYFVDKPALDLHWKMDDRKDVSYFLVRVRAEGEDESKSLNTEIKDLKVNLNIPRAGRYIASVEALKEDGTLLAKSPSQILTSSLLPVLKAPSFTAPLGLILGQQNGRASLSWTQVDGAKEYLFTVKKVTSAEVKMSEENLPQPAAAPIQQKVTSNNALVKNLTPGEYSVEVVAIDTHGRLGEIETPRKLKIPEPPESPRLRAPSSPKIKVN
jgi:hypothetical protein